MDKKTTRENQETIELFSERIDTATAGCAADTTKDPVRETAGKAAEKAETPAVSGSHAERHR